MRKDAQAMMISMFAGLAMNICGPAMAAYPDLPPRYQGEWCGVAGHKSFEVWRSCKDAPSPIRITLTEDTMTFKKHDGTELVCKRVRAAPEFQKKRIVGLFRSCR